MSAKETIKEVLQSHDLARISTIGPNGVPCVRSVDFAASDSKDNVIYFMTHKDSRKVQQIKNNQAIGFAIDHDCPTWEELQQVKYIKGTATAAFVENPQELQQAQGLMMQKFPFIENLPGEPQDFVCIKLELKEVLVTDNTISFGDTQEVTF